MSPHNQAWRICVIALVVFVFPLFSHQVGANSVTELKGAQLGEVVLEDARAFTVVTRANLNRMRKEGTEISADLQALADTAQKAFQNKEYYTAYRLFIRFQSLVHEGAISEGIEVAASYDLQLDKTIFGASENVQVRLAPLFNLGQPLSGTYTAKLSLEGSAGIIEGTEQHIKIADFQTITKTFATDTLPTGSAGIRYELLDPSGKSLVKFARTFLYTNEAASRLTKLRAQLKTINERKLADKGPTYQSATETIAYVVKHLEQMQQSYVGDFRRTTRPIVMNYRRGSRGINWAGPILVPKDIDLAEKLAQELLSESDPLKKRSGDFHLAYRSGEDQQLVPYRIFVPEGYDPNKIWPLILVLHGSSGSEHSWFDRAPRDGGEGNPCKRLAQERGYLVTAPSGRGPFAGYNGIGGQDVLDVMDRTLAMYNIDPKRVYLTGHSMGGGGTWINGFRHAERFAAIAPIAANARWLKEEHVKARADLPVLFSQGAQDVVVRPGPSRRTAKLAAQHMNNFTYNEYPDDTHSTIWHSAIVSIFDFFDKHQ